MLVYEEAENDLHHELSRIEKSGHFVCDMRALITHCAYEITRNILRSKYVQCQTE